MTIHPTSPQFKENAHAALGDRELQRALGHVRRVRGPRAGVQRAGFGQKGLGLGKSWDEHSE